MHEHQFWVQARYLSMLILRVGAGDVIFQQVSILFEESLRPAFSQRVQLRLINTNVLLILVVIKLVVVLLDQVFRRDLSLLTRTRSAADSILIVLNEITI